MIAQYFMENDIAMDKKIATALTYGIRIDTHNLSRGVSKLDIEMLYRMYDDCDYEEIHTLENSNLCFEDLVAYSKAISSIEVYDNISFADTGEDCPEALIASVSDFMLALVEVSFSVVYSRRGMASNCPSGVKNLLSTPARSRRRRCRGSETAAGMLRWQVALYRLPVRTVRRSF